MSNKALKLNERFRGYFPIVLDLETAGFNADTDAILEIAAYTVAYKNNHLVIADVYHEHVMPFEGANIEQSAIDFNGIDPFCALRNAKSEVEVINSLCTFVRAAQKSADCQRSVIVAHNAAFDQGFINAALRRHKIKRIPFHPFVSFDTTTLSALALGQTVLAKACEGAGLGFDNNAAHSALYDAKKTAELFCYIVNRYQSFGGIPAEL